MKLGFNLIETELIKFKYLQIEVDNISKYYPLMKEATLISLGAEAKVYALKDMIIKHRIPKNYRHPEIDRMLVRKRTRSERKILRKLNYNKIDVPKVLNIDGYHEDSTICMEKIEGTILRDLDIKDSHMFCLGSLVRKIHEVGVIHGDLTTSNFIFSNDNRIFAIDFGLSFLSEKSEDKAVDLYVFERAIKCFHNEDLLRSFYEGYGVSETIKKLEEVRKRGRKREESAIG